MNLNRGDVKLTYDRCVAHDVEDVGEFILDLVEYIQELRKEIELTRAQHNDSTDSFIIVANKTSNRRIEELTDTVEKIENSINELKEERYE